MVAEEDHGEDLVQTESAGQCSTSGEEKDSAELLAIALGSAASGGVLLDGSGLRVWLAEVVVLAVEVQELEGEHEVGPEDVVGQADDFQSCTVGLQH